jgi:hypothetical protein
MKSHTRARQESMSTREANGLVGAALAGRRPKAPANALLPTFDFGFGISDWKKKKRTTPSAEAAATPPFPRRGVLPDLNKLNELYTISYCSFGALHDLVIIG